MATTEASATLRPMDLKERAAYTAASDAWMLRGGGIEVVTEGQLRTEEMILNIGPQHPSTHGVLRIVLELDGEMIIRAEPVIGYMHRGAEKLSEYRDPRQVLVLMNRHDWLSAFNNELGWILAVERMLGIEVPERAQWIRTMMAEWNRLLNHLMFTGSYPLELGAIELALVDDAGKPLPVPADAKVVLATPSGAEVLSIRAAREGGPFGGEVPPGRYVLTYASGAGRRSRSTPCRCTRHRPSRARRRAPLAAPVRARGAGRRAP